MRGLGTPVRTSGYDKAKIFKENVRVNYYLRLKYSTRQCILLPLSGPNYSQTLTPKCKILRMFWTEIVSKRRIELCNFLILVFDVCVKRQNITIKGVFSIGFQMKNLFLSNGSEPGHGMEWNGKWNGTEISVWNI